MKSPNKGRFAAVQFFLRGLAISLPPILTVVIIIWIGRGIYDYIIYPTSESVRYSIALFVDASVPTDQVIEVSQLSSGNGEMARLPPLDYAGQNYAITPQLKADLQERVDNRPEEATGTASDEITYPWLRQRLSDVYIPLGQRAVPYTDYAEVAGRIRASEMPQDATGLYMELVTIRYFQSLFHLSAVAVIAMIILLYFLGRFVTARIGAWAVGKFETAFLGRLPIINHVYSSVKQVTDFFLTERTVEYNRVVAVEYPRRGIWSVGFVTSESMREITTTAGESLLSILIPTTPMPMTGFTINVPRSEVLDLNVTIDQAFQYCLSCGVLIPPQQRVTADWIRREMEERLEARQRDDHRRRSEKAAEASQAETEASS